MNIDTYINYRLEKLPIKVTRTEKGQVVFTHPKFPKLHIEEKTINDVIDKLHVIIREELKNTPWEKVDLLFDQLSSN